MKTLDEVIYAYERCRSEDVMAGCGVCAYHDVPHCGCKCERNDDALHYLKEYRETKKHLACLDDAEIRGDDTQVVNNPPLDWETLKQMEGKPVWFEYDNHLSGRKQIKYKVWDVIDWVTEDLILVKGEFCYQKDEFGDVWQAYRKERK